jgi:tripartite-type tricarboxylate transporter receptor subunit TctC
MNLQRLLVTAMTSALALLVTVDLGQGQDFYKGRRLSIIVSYVPGGGYDMYSRLLARHLPRHIPGKPSVIVQNMPGAGSVIGANYLFRIAPRDGTTVGIFGPMQVLRQVIGAPGIEFESEKFNWLASANVGDVMVCLVTAASGVKNLDDAIKRQEPLVVGATQPGSTTLTWTTAYKEVLGANFKIVAGYSGATGVRTAMARGEVDAGCWQWSTIKATEAKTWLDTGKATVFTQAAIKKTPELPHVENALDRAKSKTEREILSALLIESSLGRPYVAPPGVPNERVQILRRAFLDTLRDPKLLEEANRMALEIEPFPGEELEKVVTDLRKLSRDATEKIRSIMEQP